MEPIILLILFAFLCFIFFGNDDENKKFEKGISDLESDINELKIEIKILKSRCGKKY
jgi:regulatory protein YycI of two-component signal transduction system YycFG